MSLAAPQIDPVLQTPIDRSSPLRSVAGGRPKIEGSFAAHLEQARGGLDAGDAREAARSLVATALVQPVLAMLRESSTAEGPFAAGPGERRFGPMLDQQIADRITQSANFPLVERIAEQLQTSGARRAGLDPERSGTDAASRASIEEGRTHEPERRSPSGGAAGRDHVPPLVPTVIEIFEASPPVSIIKEGRGV